MRKIIRILILVTILLANISVTSAQENLTLKKCLNLGIENNVSIIKAKYDKKKSEYKVDESLSQGLPQIEGFIESIDNVKKSVMIVPGDLFGQPGSIFSMEMGSQYSTTAGVKINQLLYSQTYFLSLSVSRKLNELNSINIEKVKEEIIYNITKIYCLASITNQQIKLTQNNIIRLDSIIEITKASVENGYAKSIDLDRALSGKSNLLIQLDNTVELYKKQLEFMKYYINIPPEKNIELTDNIESLFSDSSVNFSQNQLSERNEIKMLELQKDLYIDNLKAIKYEYLPSLTFIGLMQYQNLRDDFKLFGTKWFGNAFIGLNLRIPIFDGLNKHSRIEQAELDINTAELTLSDTKSYFSNELENTKRNYGNNISALKRQKENIELAQNILNVSKASYSEGSMSMSDLLLDENSLNDIEQGYLNYKLQLIFSELDILKSIGKLNIILN